MGTSLQVTPSYEDETAGLFVVGGCRGYLGYRAYGGYYGYRPYAYGLYGRKKREAEPTAAAGPAADAEADPWYLYSGYYGYARPYGYGYYGYRPYYGGYYGWGGYYERKTRHDRNIDNRP